MGQVFWMKEKKLKIYMLNTTCNYFQHIGSNNNKTTHIMYGKEVNVKYWG